MAGQTLTRPSAAPATIHRASGENATHSCSSERAPGSNARATEEGSPERSPRHARTVRSNDAVANRGGGGGDDDEGCASFGEDAEGCANRAQLSMEDLVFLFGSGTNAGGGDGGAPRHARMVSRIARPGIRWGFT